MRLASGPPRQRGVPERLRGHAPDERVLVVESPEQGVDRNRRGIGPEALRGHIPDVVLLVLEPSGEGRGDTGVADPAEGFGRTVAHDPGGVSERPDQGGNRLRPYACEGAGRRRADHLLRVREGRDQRGHNRGSTALGQGQRGEGPDGGIGRFAEGLEKRPDGVVDGGNGGRHENGNYCCCWSSSISFRVFSASSFILAEIRFEAENSTVRIAFAISEPSTKIAYLCSSLLLWACCGVILSALY